VECRRGAGLWRLSELAAWGFASSRKIRPTPALETCEELCST
jgi:hypothetical protein